VRIKTTTYVVDYEGPDGEPRYYRVKATEIANANLFSVEVLVRGVRAVYTHSLVEAEQFITYHRHQVITGHAPGTCRCLAR
jgi:hypothetical protein